MPGSSFDHAIPLPERELDELARRWARAGTAVLIGAHGSGRFPLARALAGRRPAPVLVRTADAAESGARGDGWLLEELGLHHADAVPVRSVERLASEVAKRAGEVTVIVNGAERADARSLRVLTHLASRDTGVKLVLIHSDRSAARAPRFAQGAVRIVLPEMAGETTRRTVERLLGARPTEPDAAALSAASGGSFRALCWLLELLVVNGGIQIDRGILQLRLEEPAAARLPDWSIVPALLGDEAGHALALSGGLRLGELDRLGLLARAVELEQAGRVIVDGGVARLSSPALGWELAARQPEGARRLLLGRAAAVVEADDATAGVRAAELADWAGRARLRLPAPLEELAVDHLARTGRHARALAVMALDPVRSPAARATAAYCAACSDDEERALQETSELLALTHPDPAELEALGLALALGRFRHSRSAGLADALEAVIARAAEVQPASAAVLGAARALLGPRSAFDWTGFAARSESAVGSESSSARAHRLLALRAWLDGRPLTALERNAAADRIDEGAPVDAAISLFLRVTGAMLVPDFAAATEALAPTVDLRGRAALTSLLWGGQAVYRGELTAGRLLIDPLLPGGRWPIGDRALAPFAAAIASIASSMLGDGERARLLLDQAYELEARSELLAEAVEHFRGIAATQLRPEGLHDEGLAGYVAAAEAARARGFRLLELFATYRRADELGADHRPELWQWLAEQLEGPEPLEGGPALLARMARAVGARDVHGMIDLVRQLTSSELVHDAKVLSMRLVRRSATEIPATVRRTLVRLTERGLDVQANAGDSILTDREREVATLIVEGLSDREIGERFGRSRRTVSVHVGRILRKLNLASRHDLTPELAARHGVQLSEPDG
ncbi:LuxR C-terminal-related transcriptional regulator [Agromyces mediolanus]|uniref:HTH luxR-type domain-containing protein n=1 Tax=Agromyces mediolanus TaxID=41986 RepID=A0A918CDZ3_AGRME|nr:LuxR C-terminal-related transcriptional regulator [Agromyces mediolanus]GGR18795.1 hypothetical protein GCM10010196_09920 [Agromyces mediolanus]GLJ71393.1 hypothetical protein GCM10017583_06490 [Agromyces mediolanus]